MTSWDVRFFASPNLLENAEFHHPAGLHGLLQRVRSYPRLRFLAFGQLSDLTSTMKAKDETSDD